MKEEKKTNRSSDEKPKARDSSSAVEEEAFITDDRQAELRDRIARRAYELYERRGGQDGGDINDWLKAEAEVKAALKAEERRPDVARADVHDRRAAPSMISARSLRRRARPRLRRGMVHVSSSLSISDCSVMTSSSSTGFITGSVLEERNCPTSNF